MLRKIQKTFLLITINVSRLLENPWVEQFSVTELSTEDYIQLLLKVVSDGIIIQVINTFVKKAHLIKS